MKSRIPFLFRFKRAENFCKVFPQPSFRFSTAYPTLDDGSGPTLESSASRSKGSCVNSTNGGAVHKECVEGDPGKLSLVSPATTNESGSGAPVWKRCLDLFLLLLGLPVILPVMLVVALLIKLVSKGPVFFRQERIGYRGKPFTCWKFRTMHVNADPGLHREYVGKLIANDLPLVKLDLRGDKRVIPLGRFLRTSCVDEIPQLINVMLGEMSIVGPRPCMEYEYNQLLPWHRQRFNSPPGMTGLWQIKRRSGTSFSEMMQLDLHYVANRSFWLDLSIILQTLPAVCAQVRESRLAKRLRTQESRKN